MTVSAFDHPILSALVGDDDVAAHFAFEAELAAMLEFETALATAQARCGLIPADAASRITAITPGFKADIAALRAGAARDGLMVPALVAQLRAAVGEPHSRYVHFGSTSQDVLDSALMLRLKAVLPKLRARLQHVIGDLTELESRFARQPLMGRTRMQRALPITVHDRLRTWRAPLERHIVRLDDIAPRLLAVQCGGAVGTLDAMQGEGAEVARELGALLGLAVPDICWQAQRDTIAEFAGLLSLMTGSLGKIGQDVVLMAQNEIGEISLSGGGGSSAMPHKHNPVSAEVLVTLARFNAAQLAAMHGALAHEQERSGSAWTLEWLVLPQMVVATAAALRLAGKMLGGVTAMGGS